MHDLHGDRPRDPGSALDQPSDAVPTPAGLEDVRIDVTTDYTLQKKLTIPLRLFGPDKDLRVYPPTLHVTAFFMGQIVFEGFLVLKYEDSNGKARLNVSNTGNLLQRFRDHRVSGWAMLSSGEGAVMYIIPPKPRRLESPSPSGSSMPGDEDRDEADGDGALISNGANHGDIGNGRSLGGLLEAAALAHGADGSRQDRLGQYQDRDVDDDDNVSLVEEGEGLMAAATGGIKQERESEAVGEGNSDGEEEDRDRIQSVSAADSRHEGLSRDGSRLHAAPGFPRWAGGSSGGKADLSGGTPSWKSLSSSHGGGGTMGGPTPALVPVMGPVAGFGVAELLAKRPDHQSNALLTNNNISVPLALFGTSATDRVLVERIQLLANVGEGRELYDLGVFRLNCSKNTASNRMKVSLGSSGTMFKRFPESMWIHGWSKVTDTIMTAHMRVNTNATGMLPLDASSGPSRLPVSQSVSTGAGGPLAGSALAGLLMAARNGTPVVGGAAAGLASTSASPASVMGTPQSIGVKRPLPGGHGIDALIAAGVALDLSKRSRQDTMQPPAPSQHNPSRRGVPLGGDPRHQQGGAVVPNKIMPGGLLAGGNIPQFSPAAPRCSPLHTLSTQPDTGLPLLPDLETIPAGWGSMTRVFLQVLNALQFPNVVKAGLLQYLKSLTSRPGSEGKDLMEVLYAFMQDACALGDIEAVEHVLTEVLLSSPVALEAVRTRLVAAKEQLLTERRSKEADEERSCREQEASLEAAARDLLLLDGPNVAQEREREEGLKAVLQPAPLAPPASPLNRDAALGSSVTRQLPQLPQLPQASRPKRPGGGNGAGVELDLGTRQPGLMNTPSLRPRPMEPEVQGPTAENLIVEGILPQQLDASAEGTLLQQREASGSDDPGNREEGLGVMREEAELPPGWGVTLDPSGKPYFWHQVTKKTMWRRPTEDTPIE